MPTRKRVLFGLLFTLRLCGPTDPAEAKIRVVTTTTDMAAIAQEIGGGQVEVQSIAKGYQDPHYVEAKPSYMVSVNRADLLIYVGLQLEVGWLPLLIQGARNPKIAPGATGHLDVSRTIPVLEVPTGELSRAQGDIHPEGNPHYWLDPRNGLRIAAQIADRLKALSPQDDAHFEGRWEAFNRDLTARIAGWERRAAPLRGVEVVAYHKQWEYLAGWLGLSIAGYVEDRPGIPPSPKHLAALIDLMQAKRVRLILTTPFTDPGLPQRIAEKSGARVLTLPASVHHPGRSTGSSPLPGEEGVETYAGLFEHILSKLEEAR